MYISEKFSNQVGNREALGFFLFIGPLQFILSVLIGEGMAESYNSSLHYVSSLGVGSTAVLFNTSVLLLGICLLVSTYFFYLEYSERITTVFLLLTALSAIGVGVFPEDTPPFHGIFTGFVFLFAAIFLISVIRVNRSFPLVSLSIMGSVILIASLLFLPYLGLEVEDPQRFLGFMKGTLERFIIYPTVAGFLILSGYLSRSTDVKT
ncbi:MAG: DUF998 domain-containing protein [Candidatus Hodarchaeales archaeon]|jgi:hypothetical membrane protein